MIERTEEREGFLSDENRHKRYDRIQYVHTINFRVVG